MQKCWRADWASSSTGPLCRLNQSEEERLKASLITVFIQSRIKEIQFLISSLGILRACRENLTLWFLCFSNADAQKANISNIFLLFKKNPFQPFGNQDEIKVALKKIKNNFVDERNMEEKVKGPVSVCCLIMHRLNRFQPCQDMRLSVDPRLLCGRLFDVLSVLLSLRSSVVVVLYQLYV